jgi:bacterioferritin-associated ferredoxin
MPDKKKKEDTIICRCQDITLEEVEAAIDSGITEPEELKRFLHIGMGPCQGRTCSRLVQRILARKLNTKLSKLTPTRQRPPLVSIPIRSFLGEDE